MNRMLFFITALLAVVALPSCGEAEGHTHGGFEIPEGEAVPTIEVLATEDPVSGWNLQLITTNFTFSPGRAGKEFVLGEGHGHLYVDGEKQDRLYGPWYHLDNLTAGEHTIEVTLNGNNHAVYQSEGRTIRDEIAIDVEERPHIHASPSPLEAVPDMDIVLNVEEDPVGGWNVFATTPGFDWAPEHAGSEPVAGEGHAHLYVDDQKIGRIYGAATYLGPLEAGAHTITVSLHGNNHAPYTIDGEPVAASVAVDVAGETAGVHHTVTIEVRDGQAAGGVQQVEVALGDTVELAITSDKFDTLHVHGYEMVADLESGIASKFEFVANIPGVFEIELEDRGLLLIQLTVR